MERKLEIREGGANFDLIISDDAPEIYVDGVSQFNVGYPISKIQFHTVTQPSIDPAVPEQRRVNLTLAINLAALLDACRQIIQNTTKHKELLDKGVQAQVDTLRQILASLPSDQ